MSTSLSARRPDAADARADKGNTVIPINLVDLVCSGNVPVSDEVLKLADLTDLPAEIELPAVYGKSEWGGHRFIYRNRKLKRVKKNRRKQLYLFPETVNFRLLRLLFALRRLIYSYWLRKRRKPRYRNFIKNFYQAEKALFAFIVHALYQSEAISVVIVNNPLLKQKSDITLQNKEHKKILALQGQKEEKQTPVQQIKIEDNNLKKVIRPKKITYSEKIKQIGIFKLPLSARCAVTHNHNNASAHPAAANPQPLPNVNVFPLLPAMKPGAAPRL